MCVFISDSLYGMSIYNLIKNTLMWIVHDYNKYQL